MKPSDAYFPDTIAGMTDRDYAHMLELRKTMARQHVTGGENSVRSKRRIRLEPPLKRPPEIPDR